ncbi:Dfg16p Ecym_5576 [Eremothecium cymbalariae DBVPG|uniref:Uncharacterized protein n=1 Tax=Eremothecium cymbalariae (strain CBS 270.75 / DBVPG 7215 / KCTC 17166 / NRRL Y-17582) TaxID=931890 RepID=I6NE22_ERECY|nr:hypothetical protein Ecym_5576 [Eremothecium cymbalariae DBVPG\
MGSIYPDYPRIETVIIQLAAGFNCSVRMLTAGNITVHSENTVSSYVGNKPSWFIKCGDTTSYARLMDLLGEHLVDAVRYTFEKDSFRDSSLMVACVLSSVCVGSWMLLLVLLLLPVNNHNSRKRLVFLYVLFFALWQTIFLRKVTTTVFEKQYNGNYQNSHELLCMISRSLLLKYCRIVCSIFANLTWLQIVYYMFHNYKQSSSRWIPHWLDNNNKRLKWIGFPLFILHTFVWAFNLFYNDPEYNPISQTYSRKRMGLYVPFVFLEALICILFLFSICYYLCHDFGHTLTYHRQNYDSDGKASFLVSMKHILEDYKQTIPALVYNFLIFLTLIVTFMINSIVFHSALYWLFTVVTFLRVMITVNVWGLIGILEKRERVVSKMTVLGRKITNHDRFFVDPHVKIEDNKRNSGTEEQQRNFGANSLTDNNASGSESNIFHMSLFKRFRDWVTRSKTSKTTNTKSNTENAEEEILELQSLNARSGCDSNETELLRNTIFGRQS